MLEGAFPGVAQFMRGESVQGLLFGSAFLFLGRHLLEGTLVKSVPYAAISRLAGELSSTEAEAAATGRLLLLLALVALYAVHILLLRRSRGREARRVAILKSSRLAAGGPALESDDLLGARGSW